MEKGNGKEWGDPMGMQGVNYKLHSLTPLGRLEQPIRIVDENYAKSIGRHPVAAKRTEKKIGIHGNLVGATGPTRCHTSLYPEPGETQRPIKALSEATSHNRHLCIILVMRSFA